MLHTCFKGFLFMWTLCQNINLTDTILHFLSCFHCCVTLHTVSMIWNNQHCFVFNCILLPVWDNYVFKFVRVYGWNCIAQIQCTLNYPCVMVVAKDWWWRWEITWFSSECWNKILHTAFGFSRAYSCAFGEHVATLHCNYTILSLHLSPMVSIFYAYSSVCIIVCSSVNICNLWLHFYFLFVAQ